ncbi:unnamed protein product [Caenorhabditis angaria]|uniref:Uncharacterized protein n=1 Tax=Caenorhabditis angaria TaxID=860376 RepID=A0A9P1IF20_9PELO|nr:unnamed protein product [Caenorhabditis angaria]
MANNNDRRNCERSETFRNYLTANPEFKNRRPDILEEMATYFEKEELLFCCYESECLQECGYDLESLFENDMAKNIQTDAAKLLTKYNMAFFKNVAPLEFLLLFHADPDSVLIEFWKIRATHLNKIKSRLDDGRMGNENRKKPFF